MSPGLTYRDAGVDIHAADGFVAALAKLAKSTYDAGVVPGRGEYASLYRLNTGAMKDPLLAATCDGVGTKLLVAREHGSYEGLGQDLVAMNVNDLLPVGAKPLLFLDYVATGKLDPAQLLAVIRGASNACKESGCVLIGGETAEMPGLYPAGDFDLAGFACGIVDAENVPKGDVAAGDAVLALPSSGLHSNGYSLARKALLERAKLRLDAVPAGLTRSLGDELLEPTRLYVRPALELMSRVRVKTAAHVTGGGLSGRCARLAKPGTRLVLDPSAWKRPAIFDLVREAGGIAKAEMARTFNMGLGYVVVVASGDAAAAERAGWQRVGEVVAGEPGVELGDLA
jgi:phosphoribosylformylglycinamidine cyclo-ligase